MNNKHNNRPITLTEIHGEEITIEYPNSIHITLDLQTNTIDLGTKKNNEIHLIHQLSLDSLHELINLYERR